MALRQPLIAFNLSLVLLVACEKGTPDGPFARAGTIGGLDEVVGGDKAIGRPGDFMLENDQIRAVIVSGRESKGPGLYGGSLIDVDRRWNDALVDGGEGRDAFNELFPTVNMNVPLTLEPGQVWVEDDGSDGDDAVVRVIGKGDPFLILLNALWGLVGMPDMWMTHDYVLNPGESWMTLRTTVTFQATAEPVTEGEPVEYPLGGLDVIADGVSDGIIMGDFFLAGGSLDVFAPGIGFDEDGAVFRANEAGENIFADPFEFPFIACVGDGISYGLLPKEGSAYVPLFTASQTAVVGGRKAGTAERGRFPPEAAFTYERQFVVGHGDVGSVYDQILELRGEPYGTVTGAVLEQGTNLPMRHHDVFVYEPGAEYPFSQWRTDVRPDDGLIDGNFGGRLPPGDWELMVHRQGRPDGDRVPITVVEGEDVRVRLEAPRPGLLTWSITDETGQLVPSKVTIFKAGDGPTNRQPALGDPFIAGDPEYVVFAEHGTGEVALPPGRYRAVASRGLEYELDRSEVFEVDGQRSHHLDLQVLRSIDTSGWIAADFHVHSAPSHDSGVTLPDRVRSMVTEGVEFFASTDHDYLTDFAPVIEEMELTDWVQSAVGVETTTIELGHYLAFPMRRDFLGDVGGAMDWSGLTPTEIITNLRQQGTDAGYDPLVFVAHPRDGILGYFDQFGFDPFLGDVGAPSFTTPLFYVLAFSGDPAPLISAGNATLDFDALELFTSKRQDTHRKPTQAELDAYQAGDVPDDVALIDWLTRTMEEQQGLNDGTFRLTSDVEGNIDDWFTLLNLGFRHTVLGNSDSHGLTSTEAGCPRNYVMADTDSPGFLDDQAVADAVKKHQVVASYGPFVQFWAEGATIGSDVTSDGEVEIEIEVQAPSWMDVDRVELYENGTLVEEWLVPADGATNLRFSETVTRSPGRDAWYVVIVNGDEALAPVFTSVEIPYIPLDEAVTGALGGLPGIGSFLGDPIRFPKKYPILPFAMTNPIWVDVDGGGFTPAGRPAWLVPGTGG